MKPVFKQARLFSFLGIISLAAIVSGCNTQPKDDPLAGGGGLVGNWVSGDNVFTAELDNGRFISRANDTGEVLSEGEYLVASAEEVRLTWEGRLSQQSNSATCQRPDVAILNCVDQAGRSFTLRKLSS